MPNFTRYMAPRHLKSYIKSIYENQIKCGKDSNFKISLSSALGIFIGILPFWGFQTIITLGVAQLTKLNKVISFAFSCISVPPILPFVMFGCYKFGCLIMGHPALLRMDEITKKAVMNCIWDYLVGSAVLAVIAAFAVFSLMYMSLLLFGRKDPLKD